MLSLRALPRMLLRRMSSLEPKEITISVPWGHIAGKAWGDPSGKPVLALHGWQDNAGSFDTLVPLLSRELYIVAMDWPGHGRSSHRPDGNYYGTADYVADIKYIADGLNWDQFSLLAHSMGGGAASWFAGSLPDKVKCLVLLEAFGFWSEALEDLPKLTGHALKNISRFDEVETKRYPTKEAIVDRILEGHVRSDKLFNRESAHILAERGSVQLEDGSYKFTRDLRVKMMSVVKVPHQVNKTYLEAIKCPVMVTIAENSTVPLKDIWSLVENEKITIVQIPGGGHHVHLYQPKALSELVSTFLLSQTILSSFKALHKL